MTSLGPCPFCGSQDIRISKPGAQIYRALCRRCDGAGPWRQTRRDARDAWNQRAVTFTVAVLRDQEPGQ